MEYRLRQLERELASLSEEFELRMEQLKTEISDLRVQIQAEKASEKGQRKVFTYDHEKDTQNIAQAKHDYNPVQTSLPLASPLEIAQSPSLITPNSVTPEQTKSHHTTLKTNNKKAPVSASKANWLIELFSLFFEVIFATAIAKPLTFATSSYNHYQQRGLAAVFMLTLAGVVTMALGFAYLLQYSFSHWLSDTGKIFLSFGFANSILLLGILVHQKFQKMSEYAAALIGLSLLLNFICSYFAGPYFSLFSMPVTLLILLAFSGFGSWLALIFDTKVVACIALIGGTLAPLMFLNFNLSVGIFFSYCLMLALSGLWLSYKMRWPLLSMVLAVIQLLAMQVFISHHSYSPLVETNYLGICALTLLFIGYFGFALLRLLKSRRRSLLMLPIILLMAYITLSLQLNTELGWVYLINSMLAVMLFFKWRMPIKIRLYLWIIAGVLTAFAIGLLFSQDLMPVLWMLEACALLWLGFNFRSVQLRMEALLVFAVGFIALLQQLGYWLINHLNFSDSILPFDLSWLFALTSIFVFLAFEYLIHKFRSLLPKQEHYVWAIFKECFSLWLWLFVVITSLMIHLNFGFNIAATLLLVLFVRTYYYQTLPVTQLLMWLSPLLLIAPIALAIFNADSMSFRTWAFSGQLACAQILAMLWVYSGFYHRYMPNAFMRPFAYGVRIFGFLLLPILFIPEILKRYPEFLAIALCGSFAIALVIRHFVDNLVIRWQAYGLSLITAITIIAFCLNNKWQGLAALFIFSSFYLLLISRETFSQRYNLSKYYQQSIYMLMIPLAVITKLVTQSWFGIAIVLAFYSWALLMPWPLLRCVRPSRLLLIFVAWSWGLASLVILAVQPSHQNGAIMLLLLAFMALWLNTQSISLLGYRLASMKFYRRKLPIWLLYGSWHSFALITYCSWAQLFATQVSMVMISIFMLIHASVLLMLSLRQGLQILNKLSIGLFATAAIKVLMFDLNDFDLVYKVLVFMLMGALLLAVSFVYQKLKLNTDKI